MNHERRIGIIGAGIVGLAVARELALSQQTQVTVLEKEHALGLHQTGRNSGVVHAGLYYPPGSLKARLCRRGMGLLKEFCAEHHLTYRELGKVVVAVSTDELGRLDAIERRATENQVPDLGRLDRRALREIEPHVEGVAALHSPRTAVVDFVAVARRMADEVRAHDGQILLGRQVTGIRQSPGSVTVSAGAEQFGFDAVIVCAGLGTDPVARMAGLDSDVRIVPFRGEYYRLRPEARDLVRGLVYPVPDPRYPFLGVHLTRRVDDEVLVGPNAILALAREGYRWSDLSLADVRDVIAWPGFRSLAATHWRAGAKELVGSVSRRAFARLARRYVPELTFRDLSPARAGVRAQAVDRDGALVDDFRIQVSDRIAIVRNAPSPAATSSMAIAETIVEKAVKEWSRL